MINYVISISVQVQEFLDEESQKGFVDLKSNSALIYNKGHIF